MKLLGLARTTVLMTVLVVVAGLGTAHAQDDRFNVRVGGGATTPLSDIGDLFGTGSNFDIGVDLNLTDILSVRFDYLYTRFREGDTFFKDPATPTPFDAENLPVDPVRLDVPHPTHAFLFALQAASQTRPARFYGNVGGGVYRRTVQLSTPGTGLVPGFCNPYWFVCYPPVLVPVDNIIGSRSSTDFGINVGGGVEFQVADGLAIFFEGRYHYVWGPEVDGNAVLPEPAPPTQKANGSYFPFTFGLKF